MSHRDIIYLPNDKGLISVYDLAELVIEKEYPVKLWTLYKCIKLENGYSKDEILSSSDILLLMEIFCNPDLQLDAAYRRREARLKKIAEMNGEFSLNRVIQSMRVKGRMRPLDHLDEMILYDNYFFTLDEMLGIFSLQLPPDLNIEQVKFRVYLSDVTEQKWVKYQEIFDNHPKKPIWNLSVKFKKAQINIKRHQIRTITQDVLTHLIEFGYIEEFNDDNSISVKDLSSRSIINIDAAKDFLSRRGFDVQEIILPPGDLLDEEQCVVNELKTEVIRLADEIGLKKWELGVQQITQRNICAPVAKELAKNRNFWGKKGPRSSHGIRKFLVGWNFYPPSNENAEVSGGANGANGILE